MRQVFFDVETTGLSYQNGDRVIELALIEVMNGAIAETRHWYINPETTYSSRESFEIHGISNESLHDKPPFREIVDDVINFVRDADLYAHNSTFDVGMIDNELKLCGASQRLADLGRIHDTLAIARELLPGGAHNVDALCRRLGIDNSGRKYHSALTDTRLLIRIYQRMMTGSQALFTSDAREAALTLETTPTFINNAPRTRVIAPTDAEYAAHQICADYLTK